MLFLIAFGAAGFAAQYPSTSKATIVKHPPSFAFSGVTGLARTSDDAFLRPGAALQTQESVARPRQAEAFVVRAASAVEPTSSFSSGVAAAAIVEGEGTGVTPLADVIDPQRPFILYTTQPGDTVSGIAARFGIKVETILDNNPTVEDGSLIQVGQELLVPRIDGILHKVAHGETLAKIVSQYDNTSIEEVVAFKPNNLDDDDTLAAGRSLLLPGATRKPPPPPPPPPSASPGNRGSTPESPPPGGDGIFDYPLAFWNGVSDPFGVPRGAGRIHEGIDLMLYGYPASPVYSACDGVVVTTEWLTYSYGYYVVVDCGDGWTTLYAHFSEILTSVGEYVTRGTRIGTSGSTGFSTGEHLHFEIRYNGQAVDPAIYLPGFYN
ncbi:MAG: hypothetical protein Kow0010_03890 [Dehalococcoidia bacterium]